jgi:hypothetical protein
MGVVHEGQEEQSMSMSVYAQSSYERFNDALSVPETQSQNLDIQAIRLHHVDTRTVTITSQL